MERKMGDKDVELERDRSGTIFVIRTEYLERDE